MTESYARTLSVEISGLFKHPLSTSPKSCAHHEASVGLRTRRADGEAFFGNDA